MYVDAFSAFEGAVVNVEDPLAVRTLSSLTFSFANKSYSLRTKPRFKGQKLGGICSRRE
jgi:hypothetical protein